MTFLGALSLALNNHAATRRHNKNINTNTLTEIKTPVIFCCVVKTHCNMTARGRWHTHTSRLATSERDPRGFPEHLLTSELASCEFYWTYGPISLRWGSGQVSPPRLSSQWWAASPWCSAGARGSPSSACRKEPASAGNVLFLPAWNHGSLREK